MRRFLLFAALLVSSQASAATVSSTTCSSTVTTGCYTSYVPSNPAVLYQVDGTWVGTLLFEGSSTGANYVRLDAYRPTGGEALSAVTTNGAWYVPTAGLQYIRIRAEAWTSGTATVTPRAVSAPVVSVTPAAPDGGLPVTLGAQRVAVEATGPEGGSVAVSGTVGLSGSTLTSLNASVSCTHERAHRVGVSGTATPVPPNLADGGSGAMPGRTMLYIQNNNGSSHDVACGIDPGDGGVPDCSTPGFGITLFPRARYLELPVRSTDKLLCVACSGSNVPVEYLERACSK